MGCTKALDFVTPVTGAHLSFYWTMDEAGAADKVDSTVGLHWPLRFGATAIAGLFSNGTHGTPPLLPNQNPGLGIIGTGAITINQLVSTGISVWFWMEILSFGTSGSNGSFVLDTDDGAHTNRFRVLFNFTNATTGSMEVGHTNDTDNVFADTANLSWALNTWHMIAITYNKTAHTINCYVDSVLSATTPDPFTYPDLTTTDMILQDSSFGSVGESCVFDELGLCLNGALTQSQITSLYNAGSGVTWPNITPIVPYP